jgi:hypothetical protein
MKIKMNDVLSIEDILQIYSGRRLQYAIRMGVLPAPEDFSSSLQHQHKTIAKKRNAAKKAISFTRQGGQNAT